MTSPLYAQIGGELRLFLPDRRQEMRTTSLNWHDLRAPSRRVQRIALEAVPKPEDRAIRVLIDPGHGGRDLGAHGHFGIVEKDLVLDIGMQVRRELERHCNRIGAKIDVRLTREEDSTLGLRERTRVANDWNADLFVSIHANSSPVARAKGFEVYFSSTEASDKEAMAVARLENGADTTASFGVASFLSELVTDFKIRESSRFAETVFQSLSQRVSPNGVGVRQAPFAVLHGSQMPALLIEVGYVTHPEEALRLKKASYLKRVASAISSGVAEYALRLPKNGDRPEQKL